LKLLQAEVIGDLSARIIPSHVTYLSLRGPLYVILHEERYKFSSFQFGYKIFTKQKHNYKTSHKL